VLGAPDDQTFGEAFDTYHALVRSMTPLTIADPPAMRTEIVRKAKLTVGNRIAWPKNQTYTVQVLSLDGKNWIKLEARRYERLQVRDLENGISGSPILDLAGNAIGVVSTDSVGAILTEDLPKGYVRRIRDCRRSPWLRAEE
jgi:S1-C subfamily serine protease